MSARRLLFTSESVSVGHPDKVADRVADAILDGMLVENPEARVACEVLVTEGIVVVAGEISGALATESRVDRIVRDTITASGYGTGGSRVQLVRGRDPQSDQTAIGGHCSGGGRRERW